MQENETYIQKEDIASPELNKERIDELYKKLEAIEKQYSQVIEEVGKVLTMFKELKGEFPY